MSEESKCECRHCGGHLAFPTEAAGQTVECPHCKSDTLLFLPPDETSQFVSCPCQHCNREFEFDASKLVEENSLVPCPFCGQETKLIIPKKNCTPNFDTALDEEWAKSYSRFQTSIASDSESLAKKNAELKQLENVANSMTICSKQDTLTLRGDTVTIQRRGWANALAAGMNGDRTLQIATLTGIQMKPAGMMTLGYILFSYAGSKPFMGGIWAATQDPDAFLFPTDLNGQVAEFKAKVEKRMRESKQPTPTTNSSGSLTNELRNLAELKNQGILTQEEFEAAKKKLLS